ERFKQESEAKPEFEQPANGKQKQFVRPASASSAAKALANSDVGDHFFDRYPSFLKEMPGSSGSATGFIEVIRTRHRYEAIVGKNRELFRNGRVLDIMSGDGLWSMAALDAGAAHVVAIESEPKRVVVAKKTLADYGVKPQSCQFISSEVFPAMR